MVGIAIEEQVATARVMKRNFYSAIRTRDAVEPSPFRSLVHGGIMHGGQLLDPDKRLEASSYFGPTSGFGRLFAALPETSRRVGVIGLGAGSITAHARPGDVFRFYEINPQVVDLAYRRQASRVGRDSRNGGQDHRPRERGYPHPCPVRSARSPR